MNQNFNTTSFNEILDQINPYMAKVITALSFVQTYLMSNISNMCGDIPAEGITADYRDACAITLLATIQQILVALIVVLSGLFLTRCMCGCGMCCHFSGIIFLVIMYVISFNPDELIT